MSNYSQQLANAIATMTKYAVAGAPATLIKPGRPRSVSEILNVGKSFVCGYPQQVEEPSRRESH